jgi:hypothetical protein
MPDGETLRAGREGRPRTKACDEVTMGVSANQAPWQFEKRAKARHGLFQGICSIADSLKPFKSHGRRRGCERNAIRRGALGIFAR